MYSAELETRDEVADGDCGGSGEVAVAKSSVARLSVLLAGAPQAEQKRPLTGTSVPQEEQVGMNFTDTVYRVRTKQGLQQGNSVWPGKVTQDFYGNRQSP
jgi:hypothetical protein